MSESPPAKGPRLPVAAVPDKRKTDWEGSWGPGGVQLGNRGGRGREITAFLIHEPARPSQDGRVTKGLQPGFLGLRRRRKLRALGGNESEGLDLCSGRKVSGDPYY